MMSEILRKSHRGEMLAAISYEAKINSKNLNKFFDDDEEDKKE